MDLISCTIRTIRIIRIIINILQKADLNQNISINPWSEAFMNPDGREWRKKAGSGSGSTVGDTKKVGGLMHVNTKK